MSVCPTMEAKKMPYDDNDYSSRDHYRHLVRAGDVNKDVFSRGCVSQIAAPHTLFVNVFLMFSSCFPHHGAVVFRGMDSMW